jgi:PAS domain S-box-containing protein
MKIALIVDDLKENLYMLESLLKAYHYKPVCANNGAEALGLALKEPPDIIIADILMPVMDGYTLCREWKKEETLKNIPFVFYTATYTHPKDEEFALSLGADRFIIKPQEPVDFMVMIEEVLSEYHRDKLQVHEPSESSEIAILKEYNETLIRKMEDRMLKSEDAEKKIRIYANQLETEIEQRKQVEQALKESELRFRVLAESAPVGIFKTDALGTTNYVNPRWCEISQLSFKEAIGDGWLNAIHPDDRDNLALGWQQTTLISSSSKVEYRFIHPDGSIAWVMGQAVPQNDKNGNVIGYIGTITDITERKKMEADLIVSKEKAEESDRLKSAFLANMSHEVRTPLNSILGFSELLADPDFEDQQKQEFIHQIITNGNNLLSIISDIMDISKLESGELRILRSQFNVQNFISSVKESFVIQAQKKELELKLIHTENEDEISIVSDANRLRQIFNNLIINAIKFTEEGSIEIGYQNKGNLIEFYVKDTGIGIPAEYHDKIFERFRQIESEKTRKYGGNGLGLTISKNLVELMGGEIWLDSELGKGSVFYFSLPTYS